MSLARPAAVLLCLLFLVACATDALAQERQVAPMVGPWDYGETGFWRGFLWGYPSESAALSGGALRNIDELQVCPAAVERLGHAAPGDRPAALHSAVNS